MKKGKTKYERGRGTIYHSIYHYMHICTDTRYNKTLFFSVHPFLMAHSPTYQNKNEIRGWVFEIREEKIKILEKIGVGV